MSRLTRFLMGWLPLTLASTLFCALICLVGQQVLRMSANDPQIQMAEDTAEALARGGAATAMASPLRVDIAGSLAPFLIVFDDKGQPLASSGLLRGRIPAPPPGVFAWAREHGENRLTWQPARGVRIAAVLVRYRGATSGFVLAGRSLREVEERERNIGLLAGAAWAVFQAILLIGMILIEWLFFAGSRSR